MVESKSETLSNTSGVSVPGDCPPWAVGLYEKVNAVETLVNDLHGTLGLLMGHTMQSKQEIQSVKSISEVLAARMVRLDNDREISIDKLAMLRKDLRKLHEARRSNPDRLSRPGDEMNTDQREALNADQAAALIKADNDKRDKEREIAELKEALAEANRMAGQREASEAADRAERKEARRFWGRTIITVVLGVCGTVMGGYLVYRLTQPPNRTTIEQTTPIGVPSK